MPILYIFLGALLTLLVLWLASLQTLRRWWRKLLRRARHLSPRWRERELHALSEDILKSLYKQKTGELAPDLFLTETIEAERLAELPTCLANLQRAGLVAPTVYQLTPEGEKEALSVIARHRLYETYLAEHTGYPEQDWHPTAERMEHRMDSHDRTTLARKLGFPRYDPHGDPIPQPNGAIPSRSGHPLDELPSQGWVKVTALQDNPPEVYRRLREIGLYPGVHLELLQRREGQLDARLASQPKSIPQELLPYILAEPATNPPPPGIFLLSDLTPGEEAEVYAIAPSCRGAIRRRLLDLGFVRGSAVQIALQSPSRNPTAYLIRGTTIALRRDQAVHIQVITPSKEKQKA